MLRRTLPALLLLLACRRPAEQSAAPEDAASSALAAQSAAPSVDASAEAATQPPADASAPEAAAPPPPPRAQRPPRTLREWAAVCAQGAQPWSRARIEAFDDALPEDQRQRPLGDFGPVRTHLGLVRGRHGSGGLLVAGLLSMGEDRCEQLAWFPDSMRRVLFRGRLAHATGEAAQGEVAFHWLDAGLSGGGMLTVADERGALLYARFVASPTLLPPDTVELFPGGASVRVYTLDDGTNLEGTAMAQVLALTDTGLRPVLSYPAGHFRAQACRRPRGLEANACGNAPPEALSVVAQAEHPRVRITRGAGRRSSSRELEFDPSAQRFVATR